MSYFFENCSKVFSFRSFFQFLDFEFHILPKVEVKENFPRFSSFRFWVQGKIENSETLEIFFFVLNYIGTFQFLSQFIFLAFLNLELQSVSKFEVKEISEISEFSILGIGFTSNFDSSCNLICKNDKILKVKICFQIKK